MKTLPPPLPDITRESSLKILGVAFSNNLSASDHIRLVIDENAQMLYALRVYCGSTGCLTSDYRYRVPGSRSVKSDARINGVARVRHCVGYPASRRLPPPQTVLQFLRRTHQTSASSWRSATTDFSMESASTRNVLHSLLPSPFTPPRTTTYESA